ncbi:MAG: hypothetical protein ACHQUC_08490, partial [Chlamydiales bacterium]
SYFTAWMSHKTYRTQLHGNDLTALFEVFKVVDNYKSTLGGISVLPADNLHLILLQIPKYLNEGNQSEADKTLTLITKCYEGVLEGLGNLEKLLPGIDQLCQQFVERINPKIEQSQE